MARAYGLEEGGEGVDEKRGWDAKREGSTYVFMDISALDGSRSR